MDDTTKSDTTNISEENLEEKYLEEEYSDSDYDPDFDLDSLSYSDDSSDNDITSDDHKTSENEASSSKRQRKENRALQDYDPYEPSWTLEELKLLLSGLREYGTAEISELVKRVGTKSESEIKEFMLRQKRLATRALKNKSTDKEDRIAPIDKWIHKLTEMVPEDDGLNIISRVFKYISLFERREDQNENSEGIDLSDLYLILSNLLNGDGPKHANRLTSYFLYATVHSFAKKQKQINVDEERKILNASFRPRGACYSKKPQVTPDRPDPVIEQDKVLNPLRVPSRILYNKRK